MHALLRINYYYFTVGDVLMAHNALYVYAVCIKLLLYNHILLYQRY